jgi:hypothetical protein
MAILFHHSNIRLPLAGERLAAHRMTGTMALWRAADLRSSRSSIAARLTRAMPRCMQDSFRAA